LDLVEDLQNLGIIGRTVQVQARAQEREKGEEQEWERKRKKGEALDRELGKDRVRVQERGMAKATARVCRWGEPSWK
jgi:hypothetical protein